MDLTDKIKDLGAGLRDNVLASDYVSRGYFCFGQRGDDTKLVEIKGKTSEYVFVSVANIWNYNEEGASILPVDNFNNLIDEKVRLG